jgi:hypothetical protein
MQLETGVVLKLLLELSGQVEHAGVGANQAIPLSKVVQPRPRASIQ